jgi:hypothetical protein
MSIRVNGTLVVKEIKGANGKFCVGDLITSLGEFKVKEPILDQFAEGRYEGEFVIERFYLSSYVWRGKSTTDIRARLMEVFLDTVDEGKVEETQSEPDPINTEPARAASPDAIADSPVPAVMVREDGNQDPLYQELLKLFGVDLAALVWDSKEVKLDPTVDRAVFRVQRDRLKEMGYVFDAKSQSWLKKAEA